MQNLFIEYLFIILIILGLVMLANKLKLAYPIVLVLGGLALSFTSPFSHVYIEPELVFFVFLPPLLYEAAWQTSWKEFWKWRRVISGFAFPIVIITSCVVALVSNALIPGFTLALGFLLGGIISPPDAISATTIMRKLPVPRSLVSIIEGESLLNDASSLIVFRFALAAVITGQFHFGTATGSFFTVIIMGALIGLVIGFIFYAIHRWLPTTSSIETVLTLVTPYCMYYFAEHYHYSGVLAVVSGGLLLSSNRQRMLTYRSRIESVNVWTNLVFVLNGIVFLLIGLQLPFIANQLGETGMSTAIWYGLAISLTLVITRLLTTFGTVLFTKFMSQFITVADRNPGWKLPLVAGWAGMRGVVSLAAALSIPLLGQDGQAFPFRNLILFITFVVILVTLVVQGLTLPWLIRKVRPTEREGLMSHSLQELTIQREIASRSVEFLEARYNDEWADNNFLKNLHATYSLGLQYYDARLNHNMGTLGELQAGYQQVYLELLEQQRLTLIRLNSETELDDELIRKYLSLIDLEEYKLREKIILD
ncbi:MAG: Na+/H+ antiporter [Chitinophagaceae bacterium]